MININLNQEQVPPMTQTKHQESKMPIPSAPPSVKTNVLTIQEKTCSCGRWQEFKYPCRHVMAYFRKWEDMSFPDILHKQVHEYYKNRSMQQIYEYNVFPVVQDQIRYDGETNLPMVGARQSGCPKTKCLQKWSHFIDPDESAIKCTICGKGGHNCRTCPNALP